MAFQPHIHDYKRKEVEDVKRLFHEYPVVGLVNMENLPAATLQVMKKSLRGMVEIKITRKNFMRIAIEQIKDKKNIEQLKEQLEGIPALLFTKEEPFRLYKLLEKSKTQAAAKPGQKAPFDISIPAGPTPFTPGPMIGELGQLGIKTEVKEGKISVREDKVLVKEGEVISQKLSELLVKLGIEPMKEGLNLVLTYSNGEILTSKVLHIDEDAYRTNIKVAFQQSLGLAMHLGLMTPETVKPLIMKAYRAAKGIAEKQNILTPETVGRILAKTEKAAEIIQGKIPPLPPPTEAPTPKTPPQEKPPPAEKKESSSPSPSHTSSQPHPQPPQPVAQKPIPIVPKEVPPAPVQPQPVPVTPKPAPIHVEKQIPPTPVMTNQPSIVEHKQTYQLSEMEQAEKFLKDLTEKAVKVEGSKKADPRIYPEQDLNTLINKMKDKKSRGQL
jgi:large subunit ribosomal protein L10